MWHIVVIVVTWHVEIIWHTVVAVAVTHTVVVGCIIALIVCHHPVIGFWFIGNILVVVVHCTVVGWKLVTLPRITGETFL